MSSDLSKTLGLMFNPLQSMTGRPDLPSYLDKAPLSSNKNINAILYNTLFSGMTYGGAAYLWRKIHNKLLEIKWDKTKKDIQEAKLNAILPNTVPNTDLDDTADEAERRALGLTKKAGNEDDDDDISFFDFRNHILYTPIPVLVSLGAILGGRYLADKQDVDNRTDKLKTLIEGRRNELNRLQSEIIAKQYASTLNKQADKSGNSNGDNSFIEALKGFCGFNDGEKSLPAKALSAASVTSWLIALLAGGATYLITKHQDKDNQRFKALKELTAYNLTNIPENIYFDVSEMPALKSYNKSTKTTETTKNKALGISDTQRLAPLPDISVFDTEKIPTANDGLFS